MTDPCVQLAIAVSAATADHHVQGCDTHPCDLCAALTAWAVSTKHGHHGHQKGTEARTAPSTASTDPDGAVEASQGEYPPIPDTVCPATGGTHLTHAGVCARCGQTRGTYLIGRDNPADPVNAILDAPAHTTSQPAQPIQPGSPHA